MMQFSYRHLGSWLVALTAIFFFVNAQNGYTDGPFLNIPTVNVTSSARPYIRNYCPLFNMFMNNTITLGDALADQTLYVGFNPLIQGGWKVPGASETLYKIAFDPKRGPISGFHYDFWNALADKLRFKVQWVYVPTKVKTTVLPGYWLSLYRHVDVATYYSTDARLYRAAGFDFTSTHMYEQTCHLISVKTTSTPSKFWNFAIPFRTNLWILLIFTLVFTSILLRLFNPKGSTDTFTYDFFRSMNAFSGLKMNDEDNLASIVISLCLNFVMLVIAASYTANLTSLLITNEDVTTLAVPSFQYANDHGLSVGVGIPSAQYSAMAPLYPKINWLNSSPIPTQDIISGRCQAFVGCSVDIFNGYRRKLINPTCNLGVSDDAILNFPYPLMTAPSPNGRCTEFLRDILSYGIMMLKQDGTVNKLLEKSIGQQANLECPAPPPVSRSLQPGDLAGIFVIYAVMIGIALVIHFIKMCLCKPYVIPRIADGSTSVKDVAPTLQRRFSSQRLLELVETENQSPSSPGGAHVHAASNAALTSHELNEDDFLPPDGTMSGLQPRAVSESTT